jgi:hypothetical protein
METRDLVRIGIPAGQEEMFTRVPMAHKDIDKVMAV